MTGRMAEVPLESVRGSRTPVDPRPASTVILLRDAAATSPTAGPEVYLLRRQRTRGLAAGMTVFPGGRVDPADSAIADSGSGPPPAEFVARLGCSAELASPYFAAPVLDT